jgi:hypothetical protein
MRATPTGSKRMTSYVRNVISLGFAQPVISPQFLVTGGYVHDSSSFEYSVLSVADSYSAYSSKWTNNMLNVGLAFAF